MPGGSCAGRFFCLPSLSRFGELRVGRSLQRARLPRQLAHLLEHLQPLGWRRAAPDFAIKVALLFPAAVPVGTPVVIHCAYSPNFAFKSRSSFVSVATC